MRKKKRFVEHPKCTYIRTARELRQKVKLRVVHPAGNFHIVYEASVIVVLDAKVFFLLLLNATDR